MNAPDELRDGEHAALAAQSLLVREPRVLLDRRFTAALHRELVQEVGAEEAGATLLQIGFLLGLQDAHRADGSFAASAGGEALPTPLAIRCRWQPDALPRGAIELRGTWPEGFEASARVGGEIAGAAGVGGCLLSAGYTSGWLSGILDADILALESRCRTTGAACCEFVAREEEAWRSLRNERALPLLDALPFDAFRELVGADLHAPGAPPAPDPGGFDPDAAAVHIWGPVMVLPFGGVDEALRAVDLIGRDPGARAVSVVVVDLTGVILDEGFGAVALEQIVQCAEALGAETLLAGVSPLSAPALAELACPPLLIHKDLHAAIAAAFQIARARRRPL